MEGLVNSIQSVQFGQSGFDAITDTSANTGTWVAIKAIHGDAVIATGTTGAGDDLPASTTLSEGDVIYGPFTAITLSSGKVIAYRK